MKTATKKATEETIETIKNTTELSQKTVDMLLKNTVQSMEIANNYFQNVIKTNLDAQNAGIEAACAYYTGLAEIQKGLFVSKIAKHFNFNTGGLKLAIWGLTFKKNTDDDISNN